MNNNKQEDKVKPLPLVIASIAVILLVVLLFIVFGRNKEVKEAENESTATTEEAENESTATTEEAEDESTTTTEQSEDEDTTGVEQSIDNSDPDSSNTEEPGEDTIDGSENTNPPPLAESIVDVRLPSNWDALSGPEKTDLNPHGCLEKAIIRADNGQCIIKGTSINYIYIRRNSPHAWHPPLIAPWLSYTALAVPDSTSNEDMDKLFEHFRIDVVEQNFNGSSPKVVSPSKAFGERLNVFYYDDLAIFDEFNELFVKEAPKERRIYELRPKHIFGVFGFGGYTNNDAGDHKSINEEGRNGVLPEGCAASLDLALLYNPDLYADERSTFYADIRRRHRSYLLL